MSLEQTIKDTLLAEAADLDMRLQQLVRGGLMPSNTIPVLRKAITKIQGGYPLVGPEKEVMSTFLNAMMFIVLGDDAIFNKARTGAKHYATEEIDKDLEDELKKTRQTKKSVEDAKKKYANEEVEQIDEISDKARSEYAKKASAYILNKAHSMDPDEVKKWNRRQKGMKMLKKEEVEQIDEISKGKAMKALQHASSDMTDKRGYTIQKKINKKWPEMKDHTGHAAYTAAFGRTEPGKTPHERLVRDKLADRAKTSYRMTKTGKANKQDLKARFRKEEAMADIAAIKLMNESYKTTFNAALEQYGIKSPSELDEEKRKEFFNFVDQNYKKGDN